MLAVFTDRQFAAAARVIGHPELADDPRYARVDDRVRHREALDSLFAAAFAVRGTEHWVAAMSEADVPCTPINDVGSVTRDPGVLDRGAIAALPRPGGAPPLRMPASPLIIDGRRVQPSRTPPGLGDEVDDLLAELGHAPARPDDRSG